jgi:cell division protease FtsH
VKKNNKNLRQGMLYLVLIAVLLIVVASQLTRGASTATAELSTSQFVTAVNEGRVSDATYYTSSSTLSGTYWASEADKSSGAAATSFTSTYLGDDSLTTLMTSHSEINFKVDVSSSSIWVTLLSTVLPLVLIFGLMWYFMSQMQGANDKQMQFGKARTKKTNAKIDRPKTKFTDVAGIDEAVEELDEIKEFLANPAKFQALGAKIPRGVLLVGPPGTGKTLLARAVAGEAGVPFFSISGSDFVEMFVGVGASRVRDLFAQAKETSPSIIFIDEIDAVGRQRGAGLGGGHDEREQTLNQLLVEMDGFEENESVILIAATNRVDILDPALLRPGRFDRQVIVDRPDFRGRAKILEVHAKGKPLASDVNFDVLAKLTPGFTGADLANLMNEGALLAARRGRHIISMDELDEAMERVIAGPERRSRVITDKEKTIIAFHESGHALVGHSLDNADPVHKISIIARGQALGYTLSLPSEDHFLQTRAQIYDQLAVLMGGRVSEELMCGDVTTGASNDLERATKMAKQMVTRYGMSEELGAQVYGEANHEVFLGRDYSATPDYSEETANRIDAEVARIMRQAHDIAAKIISAKSDQIKLMASVLLERETVDGEAAQALLDNRWDEYVSEEQKIKAAKEAENEERRKAAEDEAARLAAQQAAQQAALQESGQPSEVPSVSENPPAPPRA